MPDQPLPLVHLARHGETAWSVTGQHTGLSDIPLTARGERNAARLGERLRGMRFAAVLTSPLQRVRRTCDLAGFSQPIVDPDLVEWDYGQYEGLTSAEIRARHPDWQLFRDGCPDGESPAQAAARADRVVQRVRELQRGSADDVLVFSSGHFIRVLAARWLDMSPWEQSRRLLLSTASLSALGYEHTLDNPAVALWNDTRHVGP